jgi:hypothetical protein
MTELNAYRSVEVPPLILDLTSGFTKLAPFTQLDETQIRLMRNFLVQTDPNILPGEVFYVGQPGTGARDIEGDDIKNKDALPPSTAAGVLATQRRTINKQLVQQADGSLLSVPVPKTGVTVHWNAAGGTSPEHYSVIQLTVLYV